jgi:hypothetical protein
MRPVLRRIAIHGGLTALVLGLFGLMFAELGAIWLSSAPGARSAEVAETADAEVADRLRGRVPFLMAVWGFGFVAVAEVLMHLYRTRRAAARAAMAPATAQPQPDEAERLLLELLAKAEAEAAARQGVGVGSPESDNREGHSPPATPPVS